MLAPVRGEFVKMQGDGTTPTDRVLTRGGFFRTPSHGFGPYGNRWPATYVSGIHLAFVAVCYSLLQLPILVARTIRYPQVTGHLSRV